MISYLLDTNIVSDMIRNPHGKPSHCFAKYEPAKICTSVIVAAELRYGYMKRNAKNLTKAVEAMLSIIQIMPMTPPVATHYGRLRTELEKAGQPIGSNDLWIAAHALALDATLVTGNVREFNRIQGLRVENWLDSA